jgi:hypothetical protein
MAPEDWLTREREYAKSFWAPSVQARCIKWKASLQGQMKQAKAAFAEEMNGMFDAIDQRYGEKEGERLRANLEPIVIDTYALIKSLIRSIDEHHLSNERSIDGQHPSNEKSILQLGTPAHSRPSSPAREAATVISMAETKPPSDPTEQPMTTVRSDQSRSNYIATVTNQRAFLAETTSGHLTSDWPAGEESKTRLGAVRRPARRGTPQ